MMTQIETKTDHFIMVHPSGGLYYFSNDVSLDNGFVFLRGAFVVSRLRPDRQSSVLLNSPPYDIFSLSRICEDRYAGIFASQYFKDYLRDPIIIKSDDINIYHVHKDELSVVFETKDEAQLEATLFYDKTVQEFNIKASRWYKYWHYVDDYAVSNKIGMKKCRWCNNSL